MSKIDWDLIKKEIEEKYPPKRVTLVSLETMNRLCLENGIVGAADSLEKAIERICNEELVEHPLAIARPKTGLFVVTVSPDAVWMVVQGVYSWQERTPISKQKYYYCQLKDYYSFVAGR